MADKATGLTPFRYLQGYPPHLQQVMQMVAEGRLGDYLAKRYPGRHQVQSDKALYGYTLELKQEYLRSALAIDKVLYDSRLDPDLDLIGLPDDGRRQLGRVQVEAAAQDASGSHWNGHECRASAQRRAEAHGQQGSGFYLRSFS